MNQKLTMHKWVDATIDNIPPAAWVAGREPNGTPYYVVRGNDPADTASFRTVGKLHLHDDGAYMANWAKVCKATRFQVLTLPDDSRTTLNWLTIDKNTCAPPNSFIVMPDHHMCIARAEQGGAWYVGVVNVDNNVCHICLSEGNDTKLIKIDDWQVLVEEIIDGPKWVETIGNRIPEHAWPAGYEADGRLLYLAYNTSVGKLGAHLEGAVVTHNGYTMDYEYSWVMTQPPDSKVSLGWVEAGKKGEIPDNSCKITTVAYLSPEAVRIARAEHKGGMEPGIYYTSSTDCYIPIKKNDKGKSIKKKSFQILTLIFP